MQYCLQKNWVNQDPLFLPLSVSKVHCFGSAFPPLFPPSLRLVVVYRKEPTQLSRLLSHGAAGLPEEPVHSAAADGLCVRGERPHHKLHSALHLYPLAHQQAALSHNQLPARLLPLESWVHHTPFLLLRVMLFFENSVNKIKHQVLWVTLGLATCWIHVNNSIPFSSEINLQINENQLLQDRPLFWPYLVTSVSPFLSKCTSFLN